MGFFSDLIDGLFGKKENTTPTNVYVQSQGIDKTTIIMIMIPIMLIALLIIFKD